MRGATVSGEAWRASRWHNGCRSGAVGDFMAPRAHDRYPIDGLISGEGSTAAPTGADLAHAYGAALAPPRPARRTGWTYFSQAAVHPSNLLLLIGVMFLSLILWSAPVLAAGAAIEGAFLALVPRMRFFRARIDEILDDVDRAALAKAREAMILQMGEAHRQELSRIEALISKAFANAERRGGLGAIQVGDPEGIAQLADSYVRLAIAHRACEESLAMTNRHALEGTIRALEAAELTSPDRTRGLLRRRLAIAYRRAECWSRTRDNLEALGHELCTIAELAQLVHQESLLPADQGSAGDVLDRCLAELEDHRGAIRELSEIGLCEPLSLPGDVAAASRRG